jgi:HK97 family phage major capsid protein
MGDLIVKSNLVLQSDILMDAVAGEFAGVQALMGTGAAVVNSSLPQLTPGQKKGINKIQVPYFGNIGEMEDITDENDALSLASLTMSGDEASVRHSGKMVELSEWAQLAAMYADPYGELARQLRVVGGRRFDKALIDEAVTTDLVKSVYVDASVGKKLLDYDTMVDAKALFGDEQEDIALLIVHSKIKADLEKLKDANGQPLLVQPANDKEVARFCGVPVKTSDRMPVIDGTNAKKYRSALVKKGALALWYNGEPEVKTDEDISKDSHVAAVHVYYIAHRYTRMPGSTKSGVVLLETNCSAD